jgi:hypothetical protein
MADPFADPSDVAARWRPLSDEESATASALLDDASALIRAEYPDIDSRIAAGVLSAASVLAVTAGMVKRAMIAPADGVSQQSETVGPYSHSQSFSNPLGNVFLTAADRVLIEGYRPRAMSVRFA